MSTIEPTTIKIESQYVSTNFLMPLFPANYSIMIGGSMKQCIDSVLTTFEGLKLSDIELNQTGHSMSVVHHAHGTHFIMIIVQDGKTNPMNTLKTIVHEANHICWFILEWLGISITPDNHEIQSYMLEEIVSKAVKCNEEFLAFINGPYLPEEK